MGSLFSTPADWLSALLQIACVDVPEAALNTQGDEMGPIRGTRKCEVMTG